MADKIVEFFIGVMRIMTRIATIVVGRGHSTASAVSEPALPDSATLVAHFKALRDKGTSPALQIARPPVAPIVPLEGTTRSDASVDEGKPAGTSSTNHSPAATFISLGREAQNALPPTMSASSSVMSSLGIGSPSVDTARAPGVAYSLMPPNAAGESPVTTAVPQSHSDAPFNITISRSMFAEDTPSSSEDALGTPVALDQMTTLFEPQTVEEGRSATSESESLRSRARGSEAATRPAAERLAPAAADNARPLPMLPPDVVMPHGPRTIPPESVPLITVLEVLSTNEWPPLPSFTDPDVPVTEREPLAVPEITRWYV